MKVHCPYDRMVNLDELKNHPLNSNKHKPEQIERLAQILEYQGWRYPIKVSKRSGFITSGHGRALAAKKLGVTEAPVSFQEYDNDAMENADLISDNAIASWAELDLSMVNEQIGELGPDFDIDLLGIEGFEIDVADRAQCDEDEMPEKVPAKSVLGDVYVLGNHRVMCGDSTMIDNVEKLMDGHKADMVFTDPPYNINYKPEDRAIGGRARSENKLGGIDNDEMSDDSFLEFLRSLNGIIIYSTKPGSPVYQCAPIGMNNLQYLQAWKDSGMHYSDGLIWFKNNHSISRKDYHPKHEVIHYGWTNGTHRWYGGRDKFSVFECSRDNVQEYKHPTQKPVELSSHFINNSSDIGSVVIDFFGGSGSTMTACEKTNRKCFMMELDPHYVDVIVSRWCKYTGNTKVIRNGEEIEWVQ